MWQRLLAAILALVAAAALLGLDVILLDAPAGSDPVGKLSVQANSVSASIPVNLATVHAWTMRPHADHVHDGGEDD